MTEWEAKYNALLAGISDTSLIDNAEKLVDIAVNVSSSSVLPFDQIFWSLMWTIAGQRRMFGPALGESLSKEQALLTLRNMLALLIEQWDSSLDDQSRHLGSDCLMLADRWVDLVAQRKGWKE